LLEIVYQAQWRGFLTLLKSGWELRKKALKSQCIVANKFNQIHTGPPGVPARYSPLRETPLADAAQRTEWNVRDADASLILVDAGGIARQRCGRKPSGALSQSRCCWSMLVGAQRRLR
jgi:hypothetical protein